MKTAQPGYQQTKQRSLYTPDKPTKEKTSHERTGNDKRDGMLSLSELKKKGRKRKLPYLIP